MADEKKCCGNCDHGTERLLPGQVRRAIECRCMPPQMMPTPAGIAAGFPLINPEWSCSQYKAKTPQLAVVSTIKPAEKPGGNAA